ncbi:hypothetical protein SAMN05216480_1232 [Pustulibacterium marinum]|uniref:Uncharacterized protein n=1 Tax=Pustulibacterium marinum TaxID=1224947 RepID=A0A1I7IVL5_9FLAO|nr:hypothetical protein [Pustulibacterium marinum]SFU76970.1 hypothetical protein SAMN05216480_1232 [Pustulibacterium marinum]
MEINDTNFFQDTVAVFEYVKDSEVINQPPDFVSKWEKIVWDNELYYNSENDQLMVSENEKTIFWNEKSYPILDTKEGFENSKGYFIETDKVSSKYWYANGGVYRFSNHWGCVNTCDWKITGELPLGYFLRKRNRRPILCFCKWENFTLVSD